MADYSPGRGYRSKQNPRPRPERAYHARSGKGFYEGRAELGVDADSYDRMKIRPTTVARGGGSPMIGQAAAIAAKEYYNYRKGGGRAGYEERLNRGGIESARMWDTQREFNAKQRGSDQEDLYPQEESSEYPPGSAPGTTPSGTAPRASGSEIFDVDPPDYQAEADAWDAAHPAVHSIGMDLTKGDTQMPTVGTVAKTVGKTIFTSAGRARARQAYGEVKMGGVPTTSASPWSAPEPSGRSSERSSVWGPPL